MDSVLRKDLIHSRTESMSLSLTSREAYDFITKTVCESLINSYMSYGEFCNSIEISLTFLEGNERMALTTHSISLPLRIALVDAVEAVNVLAGTAEQEIGILAGDFEVKIHLVSILDI